MPKQQTYVHWPLIFLLGLTLNRQPHARNPTEDPDNRVPRPLKGPMVTQPLRAMEFRGPMHWRGLAGHPRRAGQYFC